MADPDEFLILKGSQRLYPNSIGRFDTKATQMQFSKSESGRKVSREAEDFTKAKTRSHS